MKQIIHGLLGALLVVSSTASAVVSNKTHMAARGTLSDNCLVGMAARPMAGHKGSFGANVSVAGWFRQSHNAGDLAKYYGGGTTDATRLGTMTINAAEVTYVTDAGSVTLNPRRTEYGAQLNWTQCLSKFVKGLSLSVDVPFVHVSTDMRATYTHTAGTLIDNFFEGLALGRTGPAQAALAKQKHSTKANSETGVADVAVSVGYKFAGDADYKVCGSIDAIVPTGKKPAAVWAMEPLYGSKHLSLGASLNAMFNLWRSEDGKSAFDFNAGVHYKYGFCAKETRTLGLYNHTTSALMDLGHYRCVSKTTGGVDTLANLSSLEVDVTPESSLDAVAGFNYRFNRFNVGAHYNLCYNQEETVKYRTGTWTTSLDNYGLATAGESDETVAIDGGTIAKPADTTSTTYNLSLAAATTPSSVTHKLGGNVDYSFNTATPINVGVFGEGELNNNNDSLNSWAVGAKVGFCF